MEEDLSYETGDELNDEEIFNVSAIDKEASNDKDVEDIYDETTDIEFDEVIPSDTTANPDLVPDVLGNLTNIENAIKLSCIFKKHQLTYEQFDVIVSGVLSEAKANSYTDSYAVINTMYNRTKSKRWVNYTNKIMGENTGYSIYYQCIFPYQFVDFKSNRYLNFYKMDKRDLPGYQAVIDFLYTEEVMHSYLSYLSRNHPAEGREQFVNRGNWYYNELTKEDMLEEEKYLVKTK